MPLGRLWGSLFFVFLAFAALSTVFAVFENIIACFMELTSLSRKKVSLLVGVGLFVLSIPCVFGYNLWSAFEPFGAGSTILDLEDFLVSNVLLPVGSLIFCLFAVSRYGWGFDKLIREANEGKGLKIARWMRPYLCYVLPVLLVCFAVLSIVTFFL